MFVSALDVTDVALTDASGKVVLYKRCKFCPVFQFALSTTEEASHSWGETFRDQKRHRLVCGDGPVRTQRIRQLFPFPPWRKSRGPSKITRVE